MGVFQKVLWRLFRPLRGQARSHRDLMWSGLAREGGLTVAIKFKTCRIYAHTHT